MRALLDFIPLLVFFVLYKKTDRTNAEHPLLTAFGLSGGVDNNHVLVATVGLILAMIVVYGYLFVSQKFRLHKQQWFVLIMTVVFGGVTLLLSDDFYIRIKAVLINLGMGAGVLIAPWFMNNEPIFKKMFGEFFELSAAGWQKLNWAWAVLFFVMAGLHAFFAFVFMQGEYWGEFTAFGDLAVMIVFMVGMMVVLRKHLKKDLNQPS